MVFRFLLLLPALLLPGLSANAMAQPDLSRFERQLEQIRRDTLLRVDTSIPVEQRVLVDYGGFLTFSLMAIDDSLQSTHILRQTELNGYFRLNVDKVHDLFIRVANRYRDFNSGDSFDGKGDDLMELRVDRAHYTFDLKRAIGAYEGESSDFELVFKGGRQLARWANGLTLSEEIDGGVITAGAGPFDIELVVGRTRESTSDFDTSRPGFDGDTKRMLYGGMFSWQVTSEHRPFIYGLVQKDENDQDFNPDPLVNARAFDPTLPVLPTRYHYDSHYIGIGSAGNLGDQVLYTLELVHQGGEALSNSFRILPSGDFGPITQTEEFIEASALNLKIDYLFYDPNRTRAIFELVLASGDDDRLNTNNTFGGNRPGTLDRAFNGFGLIDTGLAFAPTVSNLFMIRAGLLTFPLVDNKRFERLQVGADFFLFHKYDDDAPINERTRDSAYLGSEARLFMGWQIASDVSWAMRYSVFFPGAAIETDHDARHFFYSSLTYAY